MKLNNTSSVQAIVDELNALSNPDKIEREKKICASALTIKGVSVPQIRPIVKQLQKALKNTLPEEVIQFTKELYTTKILEAQQIAIEVVKYHKIAYQSMTLDDILHFSDGMDNWVSVDSFACYLAGPAWREGRIADRIIEEWARSDDRWWRRAAVVCTVALNQKARGGKGDPERTLMICEIVKTDQDEMVTKGLSWALRELAKRETEPVLDFINRYEDILPKRVLREVKSKIKTGHKYKRPG